MLYNFRKKDCAKGWRSDTVGVTATKHKVLDPVRQAPDWLTASVTMIEFLRKRSAWDEATSHQGAGRERLGQRVDKETHETHPCAEEFTRSWKTTKVTVNDLDHLADIWIQFYGRPDALVRRRLAPAPDAFGDNHEPNVYWHLFLCQIACDLAGEEFDRAIDGKMTIRDQERGIDVVLHDRQLADWRGRKFGAVYSREAREWPTLRGLRFQSGNKSLDPVNPRSEVLQSILL